MSRDKRLEFAAAGRKSWGWPGTSSYIDRSNGWRALATVADIGQASLVERIPKISP